MPGSGTRPDLVVERDESWESGIAGRVRRHVLRSEVRWVLTADRRTFESMQCRPVGCGSAL